VCNFHSKNFLTSVESSAAFEKLLHKCTWIQNWVKGYDGQWHQEPRPTACYRLRGGASIHYGQREQPANDIMPQELAELTEHVSAALNVTFDLALVTFYKDGRIGIPLHRVISRPLFISKG
jgi:hypothetical protein